jgi:guanylate kinase
MSIIANTIANKEVSMEAKAQWENTLRQVAGHFCSGLTGQEKIEELPALLEASTWFARGQQPDQFLVMTAPSGVGKGTVGKMLESEGLINLPRVNTRQRRPNEDEHAYHFVSEAAYDEMLQRGELLCPTDSGTNRAAIKRQEIMTAIAAGMSFYIDSGAGTARQIKQQPELAQLRFSVVFILPPTFEEMVRRIYKRVGEERALLAQAGLSGGTMDDELIAQRCQIAIKHLAESVQTTDRFVVNDQVARCANKILGLFQG